MNPSPEAVAICGALAMIPAIEEHVNPDFLVTVVHDSLKPYREQVRRLVDAAERIEHWIPITSEDLEPFRAALAPFLQEDVTP